MAYRVSIDAREVSKNLEKLSLNYTKRVSLETERTATEMENYAKSNRPWKDRTGNARRSIYSVGMRQGGVFRIYTGMGVDYAKYLELYNGGKLS